MRWSAHTRARGPALAALSLLCLLPALASAEEEGKGEDGSARAADPSERRTDNEETAGNLAAGLPVTRGDGALGFTLNAGLTQLVGQGTFMSGYADNPSVLTQLSVQPSLTYGKWIFFASQAMTLEYTDPDNPTGRRVTWFDTSLGAVYPVAVDAIDTRFQFTGGLRLPVSHQSRAQGSIGGLYLGTTAMYQTPVKGLQVLVGLRGQLNSSIEGLRDGDEQSTLEDRTLGTLQAATCFTRAGEGTADACGPVPNVANLSGSLRVSYSRGKFFGVVGLSVLSLVRAYSGPDDRFRAEAARAGLNATTFTVGSISANYQLLRWLVLGAGTQSLQPIQTADGQGMRFPFWNFTGAANNYSSLFVSSTFIY